MHVSHGVVEISTTPWLTLLTPTRVIPPLASMWVVAPPQPVSLLGPAPTLSPSWWAQAIFKPNHFLYKYPNIFNPGYSLKKEQTECSETLAYKIQSLRNYPEESKHFIVYVSTFFTSIICLYNSKMNYSQSHLWFLKAEGALLSFTQTRWFTTQTMTVLCYAKQVLSSPNSYSIKDWS